jgi:hypothetical protein
MTDFGQSAGIARHKAAIRRGEPSLPLKCMMRDGILDQTKSLFDYGCGHGEDIAYAMDLGANATGWDPVFCPVEEKSASDIVNLGYVLNVIEDVRERGETLKEAWRLCRKVLTVAARITARGRGKSEIEYGDGVVTQIGTFLHTDAAQTFWQRGRVSSRHSVRLFVHQRPQNLRSPGCRCTVRPPARCRAAPARPAVERGRPGARPSARHNSGPTRRRPWHCVRIRCARAQRKTERGQTSERNTPRRPCLRRTPHQWCLQPISASCPQHQFPRSGRRSPDDGSTRTRCHIQRLGLHLGQLRSEPRTAGHATYRRPP